MYTAPGSETLYPVPQGVWLYPSSPPRQLSHGSAAYWAPVSHQCGSVLVAVAGAFMLGLQMYPGDTPLCAPQPGQGDCTLPQGRPGTCSWCPYTPAELLYPHRVPASWPGAWGVRAPHQSAGSRCCLRVSVPWQCPHVSVQQQGGCALAILQHACLPVECLYLAQGLQAPPGALVPDPEKKEAAAAVS